MNIKKESEKLSFILYIHNFFFNEVYHCPKGQKQVSHDYAKNPLPKQSDMN